MRMIDSCSLVLRENWGENDHNETRVNLVAKFGIPEANAVRNCARINRGNLGDVASSA